MERDSKDPEKYQNLQKISENDQEKAKLISDLLLKFESEYLEVVTGSKNKADLYSGDFEAQKDPLNLILSTDSNDLKVVEYEFLIKKFADLINEDLKHESNSIVITKYPDPKTNKLKDFIKENPGRGLSTIHTDIKLKSDQKNSILILAIDRYLYPKHAKSPMTEVWTLKRMEMDTDGSGDSDFSKRAKIRPRSMVRTGSLPGISSGK